MPNLATARQQFRNSESPITRQQVALGKPGAAPDYTREADVALVIQDTALAEAWLDQKQWALQWKETDILYQSPRTLQQWEGSGNTRSNVSRFTVAKHLNTLVPTMMGGLFYDPVPFVLRPRPSTTQATVRAKTALYAALLRKADFKAACEQAIECQALNGTCILKGGWTREPVIEKRFIRKKSPVRATLPFQEKQAAIHTAASDEFEVQEVETQRNLPFLEFKELGQVMPAPGWRSPNQIGKAKYIIERNYTTIRALNDLRANEEYDIPSAEELIAMFFPPAAVSAGAPSMVEQQQSANVFVHHAEGRDLKDTEDPLEQPLEILERWDKKTVRVVLRTAATKLLIRRGEHGLGRIPYFSANFWNIQSAGYGMGIGRIVGSDQRIEQGGLNGALDILSMSLNPQYLRSEGANVPTQQIRTRLGGIITVNGKVDEAFKIVEQPKVPPEVWKTLEIAKQSSESTSGADEAMTGGKLPERGGSSIGRTATGAGGIIAANANRIQGPVGRFIEGVFLPFLEFLDFMVRELMPLSEIRKIIGEELGEAFEFEPENFLNGEVNFEVLAGAHLAAKKAMAQALPLMIELFENPHLIQQLNATGWTVDVKEIFEMMMEMSEWKNSRQVIRKMSDEEAQLFKQFNAAYQKVQGDITKINAQHQADSSLEGQKSDQRMAHDLVMSAADRAAAYEGRQDFYRATEGGPFSPGSMSAQQ